MHLWSDDEAVAAEKEVWEAEQSESHEMQSC